MVRKSGLKVLLLVLAIAMIAGCSGPAPAATQAPAQSQPAATQPAAAAAPTTAVAAPTKAASEPAAGQPAKGGTLRIGYTAEIDTLNALTSQNLTDIELTMVEGLIVSNDKNSYIPVLAKEIPTVENGFVKTRDDGKLEMTWNLQQGVKWHDGVEFTADDVCFTWKFITGENSEVYNREEYLPIKECNVKDKYTAVMVWDHAFAGYAGLFEAILPKHVLEGKDVLTFDAYNRSPLGTGPYKFAEWKSGEYVRVVRNPDYWRGAEYPYVDEIVFTFIPDDNTRLNALKTGEQQFGTIQPTQVKEIKDLAGYKTWLVDQNSWMHLDFSVKSERGKKLFSDKAVRQAIAYAIDRQGIAKDVREGTVQVADSVVPANSPYFNPDVPKYPFDANKAKQMLDAAGWKPGAGGIREKDGEKLSFTIQVRAGRQDRIQTAQVIQAQLKTIGIDVKVEPIENAALSKIWRSGDWEATVSAWILPADPSFTNIYSCSGANNMTGLCDPELDTAMKDADKELEVAKRKPLMLKAQQMLMDDMLSLPLYTNVSPIVATTKLGNFKPSGTNLGPFWNVYEWYLSK